MIPKPKKWKTSSKGIYSPTTKHGLRWIVWAHDDEKVAIQIQKRKKYGKKVRFVPFTKIHIVSKYTAMEFLKNIDIDIIHLRLQLEKGEL